MIADELVIGRFAMCVTRQQQKKTRATPIGVARLLMYEEEIASAQGNHRIIIVITLRYYEE